MHLGKARNVLLYRDDCIIDTPILFHFPYGKNLCEVDMKQVETYILSFNEMAPILMREREREMFRGLIIGCVKRLNFIQEGARHRGCGVRHI